MPPPAYHQVVAGLYASDNGGVTPVPGYWAGYYTSTALGAAPDLQAIWNDPAGVFLFLKETPDDFEAFVNELRQLLPRVSPGGSLRFLWIKSSLAAGWAQWSCQTLFAVIKTGGSPSDTWWVERQATFTLGGYQLVVQGGTLLTLANNATDGYAANLADSGLSFTTPANGYTGQSGSQLVFSGKLAGVFTTNITLSQSGDDEMAGLGVMLRYATPDPDSSFGETRHLGMPVIRMPGGASITSMLAFDPIYPLLVDRSYLSLYQAGTNPALTSSFTTSRGYAITLTAANAGGALIPGRLGFCRTPLYVPAEQDTDNVYDYHLAPDGAFSLQVVPPAGVTPSDPFQFMFGLSGIESATLPSSGNAILYFSAGQNAYVTVTQNPDSANLTDHGTTAYATLLPGQAGGKGLTYYAQPLEAPLYRAGTDLGQNFMDYFPMASGTLPVYSAATGVEGAATFPLGAYQWIEPDSIPLARALEAAILAPVRRAAVGGASGASGGGGNSGQDVSTSKAPLLAAASNPYLAVTPQGLIAKLTSDLQAWAGVTIAHMPQSTHQEIEFTVVRPDMQAALQSNQLFFVVSNVDTFMQSSSVRYQLTELDMQVLKAQKVPDAVISLLNAAYGTLPTQVFENETDFLAPYPTDAQAQPYRGQVLAVAGLLEADMEGWTFQISPRSWRSGTENPTVMVFKFCGRALTDLVADAGSWAWKEVAWNNDTEQSVAPTQKILTDILAEARERWEQAQKNHTQDPIATFYEDVANNPNWNGVLFFNAPVNVAQMPPEIQFLAAGIDQQAFYAHHLGFSVTPFTPNGTGIDLQQTAAFGLINYVDQQDLVASSSIPFGFKTMQLRVRFSNAQVADFAAQVELMVNTLFGASLFKTESQRGNNLIIDGSFQRANGVPVYSFALTGYNLFATINCVLVSVEVLSVSLSSDSSADGNTLRCNFVLAGNQRFAYLSDFDLYSYGPKETGNGTKDGFLRFTGLPITMSFPRANPAQQTFIVSEGSLSYDRVNSLIRSNSLADSFPLSVSGLVSSPNLAKEGDPPTGQTPEDMGYTSISCPLDQVPMTPPWCGVVFDLDLGTLGALAGSIGLRVSLLAAWQAGQSADDLPKYLGLRLPNSPAFGGSLPIQGVLKIGFRSFEFTTYPVDPDTIGYILTLRRFALSVLFWSFPPGNTDLRIFGNPTNPGSSVGWYLAYDSGASAKGAQDGEGQGRTALLAAEAESRGVNESDHAETEPAARPDGSDAGVERRLRSGRRFPPVR